MTTHNKIPNGLLWAAGIAIIVFCGAGIAAFMGWIPASLAQPGDGAPLTQVETKQTTKAKAAPARKAALTAPVPVTCIDCGVIESARTVQIQGEGTGLGAAGGAVVGGLLGNQIGKGHGRELATVVGAVGGVMAGNEIEKRTRSTVDYQVTVRMDDGSRRIIHESNAPLWRTGDRVRIVDGVIRLV